MQKKGTVLQSTSQAWPAVAGCSLAETFSQLSSISSAQPCTNLPNRLNPLAHSDLDFIAELQKISHRRPSFVLVHLSLPRLLPILHCAILLVRLIASVALLIDLKLVLCPINCFSRICAYVPLPTTISTGLGYTKRHIRF